MPTSNPGVRHKAVATKAVVHGKPCVELGVPGIAAKNTQLTTWTAPDAVSATRVEVGENFIIMVGGEVRVLAADLPGATLSGRAVGDKMYIVIADNTLTATVGTNVKFGIISEILTAEGAVFINTNLRDAM